MTQTDTPPRSSRRPITGISSMATRQVLAELTDLCAGAAGLDASAVAIESVGGVDAARRVLAGEQFDVVVLAADAIDKLITAGRLRAGSRVDLVRSGVAVAVPAGTVPPDIGSEDALRRAVLGARSLGYSTGPSGVALARLFERWGIADQISGRIVQAPPGVPVGSLVASGQVALGFQQLSELIHLPGIQIVGALPAEVQIITTFAAGIGVESTEAEVVRALLAAMNAPTTAVIKHRQGMESA